MKRMLVALVVAPILLAGCGSTGDVKPTVTETKIAVTPPTETASPSAAPSETPKPDVFVDTTNSQADGEYVGAASDVTSSDCSGKDGTWTGAGSVLNGTSDTVNYRVWVAFLDSSGGTAGLVESDIDGVKAGESGDYSASMPYTGSDTLACVLRVERRIA